jgi:hypothetical protein
MSTTALAAQHTAWNPGLESQLPREYLPLSTVFNTANVSTSLSKAFELGDYCGLPAHELVAFRSDRLVVHELLIAVTTGLSVPDGTDYEDLGSNFRKIASTILNQYIGPRRDDLARVLHEIRTTASAKITREVSNALSRGNTTEKAASETRGLFGVTRRKTRPAASTEPPDVRERRIISEWHARAETAGNRLDESCLHALSRVATGIISRQGRLYDKSLLVELAVTLACNDYGSEVIGHAIEPFVQEAAAREGLRPLPPQEHPIVMNVKGASASGKSTMRPLQRELAERLRLPWQEFALISPDIWRKFLLDYGSLGPAYKYAGTLTAHEVEIIDKKLDLRMAAKSADGTMPHLLIDRFRFDSFVPDTETTGPGRLLTRFGDLVYMFFMITPPEMTVERAWIRGLKVGRYKAVDDLLAHNIEAYTGMPELFFTWALSTRRRVHYEFLDNSVAEGKRPRTVAHGWNREMTILDVKSMLDIDRFRKINVDARWPQEVYAGRDLAPEYNTDFLRRCARMIPAINFADYETGQIYARLESGQWAWRDEKKFARALDDPDVRAGLQAIAPEPCASTAGPPVVSANPALDKAHTLGAWGEAMPGQPQAI